MRLVLKALGHSFGDSPLFSGITRTVRPGEVIALRGPSGTGKSTMLAIIAGWIAPTDGTVDRVDIASTAWVFQNPHGVSNRSALDHASFPFLARGLLRPDASRLGAQTLAEFGLEDVAHTLFKHLSGGQAQRLMLARAVATNPSLLLIDEPTAQLDRTSAARVIESISALASDRRIVIIATHDEQVSRHATGTIDLGQA